MAETVPPPQGDAPLRLAFVAPGNSIHTRRWLEFLVRRGHAVGLVSYGRLVEPIEGVELLLELGALGTGRAGPGAYVRAALRTRAALRRFAPQVLHAHFVTGPGWLAAAAGLRPLVVSAWGSDVLLDPQRRLVRALHRLTLRRCDHATCDAAAVEAALVSLGMPARRITRIVWGVDTSVFRPRAADEARKLFAVPSDAFVVLAMRGLRPLQNPLTIIRAFRRLLAVRPDAVLLLKLGPGDEGLPPDVRRELETIDPDRVQVVPALPHASLADLYAAADVCVSVPSSDGTSVALLEAMASGCAVVASDLPANREWIRDGENGLLVSADGLAAALERLAAAPATRADWGRAARAEILARAEYEREMLRAERLYRTIVLEGLALIDSVQRAAKR